VIPFGPDTAIGGVPVRTSVWLTTPVERMVWEPCGGGWRKRVLRTVHEPMRGGLMIEGVLHVHPAMLHEIRRAAGEGGTA
jgi:hypothetical protein